jgi:hypothetical protein
MLIHEKTNTKKSHARVPLINLPSSPDLLGIHSGNSCTGTATLSCTG